jgi:hypothetical protein
MKNKKGNPLILAKDNGLSLWISNRNSNAKKEKKKRTITKMKRIRLFILIFKRERRF